MPKKGFKHSEETKRKISIAGIGRPVSKETRKKLSLLSKENRKGMRFSLEHRRNMRLAKLGKPLSLKTRENMSKVRKRENNPNWQGGISSVNHNIRSSLKYVLWREAVFKRDNYTCLWCGIRGNQTGGYLHADHIKPFAYFPEFRFEISNGRTLCKPCHEKTDTYKKKLNKVQIKEILLSTAKKKKGLHTSKLDDKL